MVYVTSDLHGAFDIHKINPDEFIPGRTMTDQDILLVCGDFGCIWDGGSSDRFWLNWLESLPWTTVFIDGNHENFDVLNRYPVEEWNGGKVRRIRSNIVTLMRGEMYHFDDKNWLALGGGFSHDCQLRKESINWWKEEIFSKDEAAHALETLKKHNKQADIIISHDVYKSHPLSTRYSKDMSVYGEDRVDQHEFLEQIRKTADYKLWLCGHYHEDRMDVTDGKPCAMLYDRVEKIDTLMDEGAKAVQECTSSHNS